jgi:ribosomal protein L16 Arg81 hydroxylase
MGRVPSFILLRESDFPGSPLFNLSSMAPDLFKPYPWVLTEGDWLYIPGAYYHKTIAGEASKSLSVGARDPTAMDYLDSLRQRLI